MTVSNNPQCCGRSMFLVTGDRPYWNCPLCGNRRDRECTGTSPGGNGFEHPDEPDAGANRVKHPDEPDAGAYRVEHLEEPETSDNPDEHSEGRSTVPALVTDYRPKCWKCGRVLGNYFSRPWSIRCRRCKANNQGDLKGD